MYQAEKLNRKQRSFDSVAEATSLTMTMKEERAATSAARLVLAFVASIDALPISAGACRCPDALSNTCSVPV